MALSVAHARWASAAAGAGVCAHLAMIWSGGWMGFAAVAMAIVCVPCAVGMWRGRSIRTARMLVGMSLCMALLHGAVLLGGAPALAHSHSGTTASSSAHALSVGLEGGAGLGGGGVALHDLPMLTAMAADFTAALLAASWIRRRSAAGQHTA